MDIDEVLNYLSNTTKEKNFKKTKHFEIRIKLREDNIPNEGELF